ncbi:MAG: ribonuclease III [Nitriliruptoraceae bacterium]|nr:ribonuclease III [Nitriliruptoraceae bacterium]
MSAPAAPAGDPAPDLQALLERLQVHLDDVGVLRRALTHRSWAFENGGVEPNERLEFLGDAVLGLVVTDEIFHAHPDEQEGRLAKVRSAAVKTASLAEVARGIGLGRHILLGVGEAQSGGADKDSILADTLEAVLGAVYLDQGFASAYDLIERLFAEVLVELADRGAALDYKTSLQELTAAHYELLPRYQVTDTGPDHAKAFTATVSVAGEVVGAGEGRNKKEAEQRAAREAYRELAARIDRAGGRAPDPADASGPSVPRAVGDGSDVG